MEIVFQIRRTDYSMIGYSSAGNAWWQINCDGQDYWEYFTFNWNNNPAWSWWTVARKSFTIYHNSDGTKSINFWAKYKTYINPDYFEASGSATLTTIPRYANITSFKLDSSDTTSARFSWSADKSISKLWYRLDNGGWTEIGVNNSFTVSGLAPSTTHTLDISVRNAQSGLDSYSSKVAFSTKAIATLVNSPFRFTVGQDVTFSISNPANHNAFLRLYVQNGSNWQLLYGKYIGTASSHTVPTSSYADTIYKIYTTSTTASMKVEIGLSANGTEYKNTYTGTGTISDASPTPCGGNAWVEPSSIREFFGDIISGLSAWGDGVIVAIKQKSTPQKYASISYYDVRFNNVTKRVYEDTSKSELRVLFDTPTTAGQYYATITTTDSRGLQAGVMFRPPIVIYPYKPPILNVELNRENNFLQTTAIGLRGYASRITKDGTDKNSNITIEYRYRQKGASSFNSYQVIAASKNISGEDFRFDYSNASFISLDIRLDYDFQFRITDSVTSRTFSVFVSRGVPIMTVADNGKVVINAPPSNDILKNPNALIVGTDITATDRAGRQREVLSEITKRISFTNGMVEPQDVMDDTLWAPIIQTITLS